MKRIKLVEFIEKGPEYTNYFPRINQENSKLLSSEQNSFFFTEQKKPKKRKVKQKFFSTQVESYVQEEVPLLKKLSILEAKEGFKEVPYLSHREESQEMDKYTKYITRLS